MDERLKDLGHMVALGSVFSPPKKENEMQTVAGGKSSTLRLGQEGELGEAFARDDGIILQSGRGGYRQGRGRGRR